MAVDRDPRTKRLRPGSVLNPAGRNQYDSRRARLDAITEQIAGEVEAGCEGTREERLIREMWKRAQDGNAALIGHARQGAGETIDAENQCARYRERNEGGRREFQTGSYYFCSRCQAVMQH